MAGNRRRRRIEGVSDKRPALGTYLNVIVLVFVAVTALGVTYQRGMATTDAAAAAVGDASFAADLAARDIDRALDLAGSTVGDLAANTAVSQAFTSPGTCSLAFAGAGAFTTGHLDIVGTDGAVACSSMAATSVGYPAGAWLAGALAGPTMAGPVVDARSGAQTVVVTAPIPTVGFVAAFLNLDALGSGLSATFEGRRRLEFLVTTADDRHAAARSIDSARWAGAPLSAGQFSTVGHGMPVRDVDGTRRLYGSATVRATGWRVYAGADRAQALALVDGLARRELLVALAVLVVMVMVAYAISRRIASPISVLSDHLRKTEKSGPPEPVPVGGPREVAQLSERFNQLTAELRHELDATARLAAIVESSNDSIISWTEHGVIATWNAGSERMYGYRADEAVGQDMSLIVPPDCMAETARTQERVLRGEPVEFLHARRVRSDGTVVEVAVTVSPIRDRNGVVVGLATVGRDVTAARRAEAERRSLEERLHQSQRLESLGQLAGGVAHDFNNLLAVILNYATFVGEAVPGNFRVQSDVRQILSASERAAQLTRQLLMFARREPVRPENLNLNSVVEGLHGLLARSIGSQVELVVHAGTDLPAVLADRGQTEQVLLNLAVNARDAMPDGGTLTVTTAVLDVDHEFARLHPTAAPGRYVQLSVSDSGEGMSRDVAARAFEPFFTTKAKTEGTGLGLATVYGIISEAGGAVTLYSEEGLGTTIRVCFPVAPGPSEAGPGAEPEAVIRGHGERILVVEDEPAVRALTVRILRRGGYDVLEAASGPEAISVAAGERLDLLLTDVVMPKMAGPRVADRLRSTRPALPVLYMSGYAHGVLGPRRALDDGVALIEKPFTQLSLLKRVHETMVAGASVPVGSPALP